LKALYKEHMDHNGSGKWLDEKMNERFAENKHLVDTLLELRKAEQDAEEHGEKIPEAFIAADDDGNLEEIAISDIKSHAAAVVAKKMNETNLTLKQLFFIGLDDQDTIVNKGLCSAADILQFAVEKKLSLRPYDKDMIVMLHEIEYETVKGGKTTQHLTRSSLMVKGDNSLRTAMAKTVGLPLGIAAKLILTGQIRMSGLHIPTSNEIYAPVLKELAQYGVRFEEANSVINQD
jgi:hypothetical protein